ncbi:hypothetical protein LBWT_X4640 (plasmid) [Leptolyngbya boryana IAM M-101]|nr:hypothetical protein LBWT_X4640 [Leptolyngbya boryana IAM M-101]BAS66740.1 hypothetical protein LBDG_X4640 [Leptolyngbya boryana dg5]
MLLEERNQFTAIFLFLPISERIKLAGLFLEQTRLSSPYLIYA